MNLAVVGLILFVTVAMAVALKGRQMPLPVQVVTLGLVCLLGYAVFSYQRDESARNERDAIQRDFDAQHDAWQRDVDQYNQCLADADERVQRVDDARAYEVVDIGEFTAALKALSPSERVVEFADDLEARRLASLDRLRTRLDPKAERAKCSSPGPEPTLPN